MLRLEFRVSVWVLGRSSVIGKERPTGRRLAQHLNGTDKHKALHAGANGGFRQLTGSFDIHVAERLQRIGRIVIHNVNARRQMHHAINTGERLIPVGRLGQIADHHRLAALRQRRRRKLRAPHMEPVPQQPFT